MKKISRFFKRELKKIKRVIPIVEYIYLIQYFIYLVRENRKIINSKNKILKSMACKRGEVFLVDFGFGIGSEFRYKHYCVVLKADRDDVIVVPFTSKVHNTQLIVNLGIIPDLQNKKILCETYALVKAIRSINRNRLRRPRINGKIKYIKLKASQLDLIEKVIKNHLVY